MTKSRCTMIYFMAAVIFTVAKFIHDHEWTLLLQSTPVIILSEALFCLGGLLMLLAAGRHLRPLGTKLLERRELLAGLRESVKTPLSSLGLACNWIGALVLPVYVIERQLDAPRPDWSLVAIWSVEIIAVFAIRAPAIPLILRHRKESTAHV